MESCSTTSLACDAETGRLGLWDERPWGKPSLNGAPWNEPPVDWSTCIAQNHHEEFQYYMDQNGYEDLYDYGFHVHGNRYTYNKVYGSKTRMDSESYVLMKSSGKTLGLLRKDLGLLVHRCARGPGGCLKRQTQLSKYGFISSRAAPRIGYASNYDMAYSKAISRMGLDASHAKETYVL